MYKQIKENLNDLQKNLDKLSKEVEADRQTSLNLADNCSKVVDQVNERVNQHFEDITSLSDRLNLVEGMIDIFKKDIEELRNLLYSINEKGETT